MQVAVQVVLALGVAASYLATLAFARLHSPLARLHAVTFLNLTTGTAILLAAWLSDGLSVRSAKVSLLWAAMLLGGALLSHASGRALLTRGDRRR